MKEYTVSLIFNENLSQVLLIEKTHPANFAGKLNGVGGKLEDGDANHEESALREVEEECGLTRDDDLHEFLEIGSVSTPKTFISFWVGTAKPTATPQSKTEEKVDWYKVDTLKDRVLVNNTQRIINFSITELTKLKSNKIYELEKINLEQTLDLM